MAGLAKLLSLCNWRVSGCDSNPDGERAGWLQVNGIELFKGHSEKHISPRLEILVATPAVQSDSPERQAAIRAGIPILSRGEVLAQLMSSMRGVAICGSHGKTTTSCFTASLLENLGMNPAWCIGGKTDRLGAVSGCAQIPGRETMLVAESDESDGTLALYHPEVTVINAVDLDHVDHFSDENELIECFKRVVSQTRRGVAVCADSPRAMRAVADAAVEKLTFALNNHADITAREIVMGSRGCSFIPVFRGRTFPSVSLPYTGIHNISNALAASAGAILLGCEPLRVFEKLKESCSQLPDRRFQHLGQWHGVDVITDYAHHPEELKAMQKMALALKPNRLITVFQPHRYSRTKAFLEEFPKALLGSCETILLPVYAASEPLIPGGTSADLYRSFRMHDKTQRVLLAQSKEEVRKYLQRTLRDGDLLMLAGAGDVIELGELATRDKDQRTDFSELEREAQLSIRFEAPMRNLNFFKCGGSAEALVTVESVEALRKTVLFAGRNGIDLHLIGLGANTWVPDTGLNGIVLDLARSRWGEIKRIDERTIEVPTHITGGALLEYCTANGLSGIEKLDSIPGTVGGLLAMNAGAFDASIGQVVSEITCLESNGEIKSWPAAQCGFAYRRCSLLQDGRHRRIAISCKMQLVPCDRNEIEEARRSIRSRRLPLQGLRCEGSVFKNPEHGSAGKILDAAGCKGYRVGQAEVSDFHANIIVTGENAAASDVLALVQILRTKAFEASGIRLEPEIRGLTLHGKEQS